MVLFDDGLLGSISPLWSAAYFSGLYFNLLWSRSLIETSDRVKWDSLISKDFIFEVSSQSLKRRKAEI